MQLNKIQQYPNNIKYFLMKFGMQKIEKIFLEPAVQLQIIFMLMTFYGNLVYLCVESAVL